MTVEIPEAVEKALGDTPEKVRRRALECMVLEGYRSGNLGHDDVRELLDLSWHEAEDFLAKNGAMLQYTAQDVQREVAEAKRRGGNQ